MSDQLDDDNDEKLAYALHLWDKLLGNYKSGDRNSIKIMDRLTTLAIIDYMEERVNKDDRYALLIGERIKSIGEIYE